MKGSGGSVADAHALVSRSSGSRPSRGAWQWMWAEISAVKGGWVYIMTNAPHGTLYIGVTTDLAARVHQHKTGDGSDFCRRYGLDRLVYTEALPTIEEAIAREKAVKKWQRRWKTDLISKVNPPWDDLFERINE